MVVTVVIVLVVVGLGVIGVLAPDPPSESADAEDSYTRKTEAFLAAQDFVRDNLKAPSTAEFGGIRDDGSGVNDLGNEEYEVGSYVDSENSFGAKLRMHYECGLRRDPAEGTFYLVDLKTDEDQQ